MLRPCLCCLLATLLLAEAAGGAPHVRPLKGIGLGGHTGAAVTRAYTFFERPRSLSASELQTELEVLQLWNESWTANGWATRVLGLADARRHPQFEHSLAAFVSLPPGPRGSLDVELPNYLRWLAVAQAEAESGGVGAAVLTEADVLNLHWHARGSTGHWVGVD
jgi:hypothetical protein